MKWRDGPVSLHLSTHAYFGIDELAYPAVRGYGADGRERWAYIHRLNAIAWFFDPDEHESPLEVVDDYHVHHEDGAPPNNAESNLEVMDPDEHDELTRREPSRSWFRLEELDVEAIRAIDVEPEEALA